LSRRLFHVDTLNRFRVSIVDGEARAAVPPSRSIPLQPQTEIPKYATVPDPCRHNARPWRRYSRGRPEILRFPRSRYPSLLPQTATTGSSRHSVRQDVSVRLMTYYLWVHHPLTVDPNNSVNAEAANTISPNPPLATPRKTLPPSAWLRRSSILRSGAFELLHWLLATITATQICAVISSLRSTTADNGTPPTLMRASLTQSR